MRQWAIDASPGTPSHVLTEAIAHLGEIRFEQTLLDSLYPVLPAASCSVYRYTQSDPTRSNTIA